EVISAAIEPHQHFLPYPVYPYDQFYYQDNKRIESQGGAVGISDNEDVLLKWMVSVPDISRIIT
ncbi:hypothetical protein AVEN_137714-1, partial [Araneus ventricosus]